MRCLLSSLSCFFSSRWVTSPRASGWNDGRPEGLRYGAHMTLDYIIGLLVTAALLVYLTYALLRPERF